MIRLISGDSIPFIRQLVRTNGKCSRNRIYLIVSELQDGNGVATEAVRAVMEVHTRITNRLAVPYVGLAFGTLDGQIGGVRTEDVERQNDHAVATSCLVIGMTIDAALGKRLICKDISLSLTHRMLDQRLRDIANGEVQHMDHAVVTRCIFLHFGVLTGYRIGLAVIAPYMGLARTDRYRLFVAIDLLVDVRSDDTVATQGRLIGEYIRARSWNRLLTIGGREGEESDALRPCIGRVHRQVQDIERIDLSAGRLDCVVVDTAVVIGFTAPRLTVSLADRVPLGVGVHHMRRLFESYV